MNGPDDADRTVASEEAPTPGPSQPSSLPPPPPDTAPPLAWAVYYRELGWWPLPVRDAADVASWIEYLVADGVKRGLTEDEAAKEAKGRAKSGSKSTFIKWRKMRTPPTAGQIRKWWEDRPERGIVLLTGPGRGITAIDIDPKDGGDGTPWEGSTPCVAGSPSGGCHFVYREAEVRSTRSELGPGVDTRGIGGLIAAPAGTASPGRSWLAWGEPAEFPAETAARIAPGAPRAVQGLAADADLGDELAGLVVAPSKADRSFAAALLEPAPDGERHRRAQAIIGLLARPRPLPKDATEAALKLLADTAEAKEYPVGFLRALERAWSEALAAPSRTEAFALEVLSSWNSTRGAPPWDSWKVEQTTRGLWKTATGREEAQALAREGEEATEDDLDQFLPTLAAVYTSADFTADCRRGLLSISHLPHWADYTGEIDQAIITGHGWGEVLDTALGGGISPGYFCVLGAEQAKGGKSAFCEQLLFGLALRSAAVLAKKASGPVVIPYYVSEMWQGGEAGKRPPPARQITHRALARWLGVDGNIFRRGHDNAGAAPGIQRLAALLSEGDAEPVDPQALAVQILSTAKQAIEGGLYAAAAKLIVPVNVRWLASGHDQAEGGPPVDHRRGVPFLRNLVLTINADRERRAKAWGLDPSEVWPLLFIDPIQRFQGSGDNAVGSLDEFVEELRAIADEHQLIVLATSDTNKDSAKGGVPKDATPFARAAWVFRGSYKLLHLPDSALVLSVKWPDTPTPGARPHAQIWVALNRWGAPTFEPAHFSFVPESGRFLPLAHAPVDTSDLDIEEDEEEPQPRQKGGRFGRKGKGK